MSKDTTVEWIEKEINSLFEMFESKEISKSNFIKLKHNLFYPAREMEKQQSIDFARLCLNKAKDLDILTSFMDAEQYYNETFNK